jgi:hypothetical protein
MACGQIIGGLLVKHRRRRPHVSRHRRRRK